MNNKILKKYAELVVKVGVNVQKGQEVNLVVSTDHSKFAYYISEWCYKVGAKRVNVEWFNDDIDRLNNKKQTLSTMKDMPNWKIEKYKDMSQILPCRIFVESSDPDILKGIDQNKLAKAKMANYPKYKKYLDEMDNKYQWTIVAAPSKTWAKKVFPHLDSKKAYKKLWEAILYTTRVSEEPIKEWEEHNKYLKEKCKKLNDYDFKELHFTSSNGTDLHIGMMENQQFAAGSETSLQNITFNPNMPSEECFGMPSKYGVNGVVYSTKPLSYNGELIVDFSIRFENGKAVFSPFRDIFPLEDSPLPEDKDGWLIFFDEFKVKPENVFILACRDLDEGEVELIKELNLNVWNMSDIKDGDLDSILSDLLLKIKEKNIKNIHLSYDIDCLDPEYVPGTGTPVADGLTFEESKKILQCIFSTSLVKSMDFVPCLFLALTV